VTEKERFEDWAVYKRELDITPNPIKGSNFDYADIITEDHWQCWKAASGLEHK